MQPQDFTAPQAGRVIRSPRGFHAFVPALLPPALTCSPELVRLRPTPH